MRFRNRPDEANKRFAALVEEMNGESERAVAIVGTAWVEEALSDALHSFMHVHAESRKRLFGGNGPLGTFSAKIDLARLLGMVSDFVWADLHRMRHIRNEFAHNIAHEADHTKLSFSTDHIRQKCLALKCIEHENLSDPRVAFTRACATLNGDLDFFTLIGGRIQTPSRVFAQGVESGSDQTE